MTGVDPNKLGDYKGRRMERKIEKEKGEAESEREMGEEEETKIMKLF